jgi:hypothetical protein
VSVGRSGHTRIVPAAGQLIRGNRPQSVDLRPRLRGFLRDDSAYQRFVDGDFQGCSSFGASAAGDFRPDCGSPEAP